MFAIEEAVFSTDVIGDTQEELKARISVHPFLAACRAGTIGRPRLNRLLTQHAKYGEHFTRFLSALMANLRSGDDCLRLAGNLLEEIGLAEDSPTPHSKLYREMLADLGVNPADEPVYPETQSLIDTMYMLCRQTDPANGLGALCLGAEAIVPVFYADIVEGFVQAGVPRERLGFFTLHIECDDGHADTMRDIMARMVADDPASVVTMVSAGEAALNARLRLFDRLMAGGAQ
jgi:pyrroloquinoline-quinone synthase